ncbi:hypothetical protein V8G54_001514 [Vigna mungo]|uniref:Transmembrane 9 superfamily member n=1 Tax=Vigna mungo TaxID=3915 RepID=A0AAQ3P8G0_VIGMU
MSSIWMGRVYYVFGFLLIVLILLVVVCAEVSLVLTCMHLCVEDWRWWWKSFFGFGSVVIYIFLYFINYVVFDLKNLNGSVSTTLPGIFLIHGSCNRVDYCRLEELCRKTIMQRREYRV